VARSNKTLIYDAIRIEGGILPAEFLEQIGALVAPSQQEGDYQVPKGLKLRDEIGRYWRIAIGLWEGWHSENREAVSHWLLPLLEQATGFDSVRAVKGCQIAERHFPVTHFSSGELVPMVLAGPEVDLDKGHTLFGEEGRKRSPHGLLQEYLNAEEKSLWGVVSNGHKIRLLRDNPSLTRPAYVEVDLRRIFEEELYADFAAFWLIFHASRFQATDDQPQSCILERWRAEAHEVGERALDRLRYGVEQALRSLGNGFLAHKENTALLQRLESGELSTIEYFQQLLRLVYRFLFLITVEERGLLNNPNDSEEAKHRYQQGYSISQLRDRSLKRRHYNRHHDQWEGLKIVFASLAKGEPLLALPALGGLFRLDQSPDLDQAHLGNKALMEALFVLSFFKTDQTLARINYRDMDTEELGSVYESLLELVPTLQLETHPWRFGFLGDSEESVSGTARKLSGSYYTPDELVQELIQSALVPVIDQRLQQSRLEGVNQRDALLSIKVCDPASGSGHFLLAAARRLAAELARIDAGMDQPTESHYRHALRDVVAHCIYGVDLNPLAVELCKTALWLETIEPGKPLGFLDSHIRHGNSLVGIHNLEQMKGGIPDDAYKKLTGDDQPTITALKRRNRTSRQGQGDLFASHQSDLAVCAGDVEQMPEEGLEQIENKRRAWEALLNSQSCQDERLLADTFCAAFFANKNSESGVLVPTNVELALLETGGELPEEMSEMVQQLAKEHHFFHWYLVFPEITQKGGFDVLLGNPPWDVSQLNEKEYFSTRLPSIAVLKGAKRKRAIELLENNSPNIWHQYVHDKHQIEATNHFYREAGRNRLTAIGKLNLYSIFAEHFSNGVNSHGRAGVIVPTGVATDDSTKLFFANLVEDKRLVSLFDFENREGIFSGVHRSYKFCLLTLAQHIDRAQLLFFATQPEQLNDERRRFSRTAEEFSLINPNTRTCPVFRSQMDAELTKKLYRAAPVLILEEKENQAKENPWGVSFLQGLFNVTSASGLFQTYRNLDESGATSDGSDWILEGVRYQPLYEAKMIHHYDHRWATFEEDGESNRDCTLQEKQDPGFQNRPRYWVPEQEVEKRLATKGWERQWLIGWRDITNATNERTVISEVIPRAGVGNNMPLIFPDPEIKPSLVACMLGNLTSLVFDFVARQKVGGTHLNFFIIKQLPLLEPTQYTETDIEYIIPRILELTYTAYDIKPWAEDLGYDGDPFPFDPVRRHQLRCELDAYYARLYRLTRDELRYILDPSDVMGEEYPSETFRGLKNNEIREFGEYRTQKMVLHYFDQLSNQ